MAVIGTTVPVVWLAAAPQATPETIDLGSVLESEDRPRWCQETTVNLMHYVTYIFQKLFGYSKPRATELMMKVHEEGKAVVSAGTRDRSEHDVQRYRGRIVGDDAARRSVGHR